MGPRRLATTGGLAALVSVLIVLLYAARIGRRIGEPAVVSGLVVVLLVAAVAVAAWFAVVSARVRGQVARVARHRPGAPLFVGRPTTALTAEARNLRAGTRGLPPDCPDREHVVYAILTDRVELWVRGDDAPRWWVTLPAPVAAGTVRSGRRELDALTVRDASARLQLVPTSDAARAWPSRAHRAAAVAHARELLQR
ncbi:hypothetical protein BCE75_106216 [Isoptericola sp. CG 20/1183]|uniref:Integral membrane protein n=1 Tax=Isoptericola halotolerans TaxID=300560 RepID=A0ABX5ED70_9MICO|nr:MULTISPECIES: hypothetical protein [Isoptericola]PRZ06347.1 hypothetical protein BCL65_10618 [Isoptericola halotolerans]PRZ06847.1 hypothetical protein BCE75_106216 [Isoptericola sp. CG 20/1183]